MKKVMLLPDIHHPYHNKRAVETVFKFAKWWKPDTIVLLGDAMEMRAINHWKQSKGNKRDFEGVRLFDDYASFSKEILDPIEKICPKARKIYFGGNHEHWIYDVINRLPQEMQGFAEVEKALKLKERGWEWIPFIKDGRRGIIRMGKITLTHGHYTNKYHASKTCDTYSGSVVYAHAHDLQSHTKVHIEDPNDYHTSTSIGCLCDLSPEFLWGQPNRWVHAFGVLYVRDGGCYNLYVPVIINGKFTYAGKTFGGK